MDARPTKEWLYEKYWGEMLSVRAVAEANGHSTTPITDALEAYGIPTRLSGKTEQDSSPFQSFYGDDEVPPDKREEDESEDIPHGTVTRTHDDYTPDEKPYQNKHRLYELYWGETKTVAEVAEELEPGPWKVRKVMKELGIPLRPSIYCKDNTISKFHGFYDGNQATTGDGESFERNRLNFEERQEDVGWADAAEKEDTSGTVATFGD